MNGMALAVAAVLASYVLGSLPTGLWLGLRVRGVDIREHGSKNIGATNTMRVLGKGLGAVALLGDVAKGAVTVLLVARIASWEFAPLVCGLAAIVGHSWSLFLRFHGGKGVATSAGVFLGLCPAAMGIAALVFAVTVAATRTVSAGSILGAVAFVAAACILPYPMPLRAIAMAVAALVIVKHRGNIQRIVSGEESRL
ncbi:MAG: glycerol-3-phosphate 1-O-acyltransferase PlsY [Candidatus Hydrogenedentes bacterium]|jgi:glycerol-3-phosphate acyltransferase PlsY|nr:glycerol-3-phosphate 1-O-acyltransferase PlsY [Candidatus Hydrogenedentota bacterium]